MKPLRLMLWLKWMLTFRGVRASKYRLFNFLLMLVFFVPVAYVAANVVQDMLESASSLQEQFYIVRDILGVIYALWIVSPLLGFQLNEAYDITKLFVYPVDYRTIFAGSVLGNFLELSFFATVPTFWVIVRQFSPGFIPALFGTAMLIAFMLHTVTLAQALLVTQFGFLKSRKFRDIAIVLVPLIGLSYNLMQRLWIQHMGMLFDGGFANAPGWRFINFIPPGYAAYALLDAAQAQYLPALVYLLITLVAAAAATFLAVRAIKSLYFGDVGPITAQAARPESIPTDTNATSSVSRFLKPEMAAIALKELIYLQRDPQYKVLIVQVFYIVILLALPAIMPQEGMGNSFGHFRMVGTVGIVTILYMLPIIFNIFGNEGAAITTLFSFPTSRRTLLIGKNLAHTSLLLLVDTLSLAISGFMQRGLNDTAIGIWGCIALGIPILLAVGNCTSIWFPSTGVTRGQRWAKGTLASQGSGAGCLNTTLRFVSFIAATILIIPIAAAIFVPIYFGSDLWLPLTVVGAGCYAAVVYGFVLRRSETWLLEREPEIIERVVPKEA